jgi:hypothetical protein
MIEPPPKCGVDIVVCCVLRAYGHVCDDDRAVARSALGSSPSRCRRTANRQPPTAIATTGTPVALSQDAVVARGR